MKSFRLFPSPGRALLLAGALLALGGCTAPLADSPYQRIVKPRPEGRPRFVRVEAVAAPDPQSVVSPSEPPPEMVREAACEALANTPFLCADPQNPREAPEYLIRLSYHVQEGYALRSSPGQRARQSVLSGGRVFGEHDPPQDAAHEIVWRFTLARAEGGEVLFQGGPFRRHIQFWRFDVVYWLGRYFSE